MLWYSWPTFTLSRLSFMGVGLRIPKLRRTRGRPTWTLGPSTMFMGRGRRVSGVEAQSRSQWWVLARHPPTELTHQSPPPPQLTNLTRLNPQPWLQPSHLKDSYVPLLITWTQVFRLRRELRLPQSSPPHPPKKPPPRSNYWWLLWKIYLKRVQLKSKSIILCLISKIKILWRKNSRFNL